jgi:hypothetical protein
MDLLQALPGWARVLVVAAVALAAHLLVRGVRHAAGWLVYPRTSPAAARALFSRRHPKVATVATLLSSAVTFAVFLRATFRIWPGQQPAIETLFRQRVTSGLRAAGGEFADWMVTLTTPRGGAA